jgi:hypothetical protein
MPVEIDDAHTIARELVGVLPLGARPEVLSRCGRLTHRVQGDGNRALEAVVEAIDHITEPVQLPDWHPSPLQASLVRRMLHVLLASQDVGWPGLDAPVGIRRVAAADLFFDATQTVLGDHDWRGPDGIEFALLLVLSRRIVHLRPDEAARAAGRGSHPEGSGEVLGRIHKVRRPRGE